VLYLALEEHKGLLRKKLTAMGATKNDPIYLHVGSAPEAALPTLKIELEKLKPVLLVIDPLIKLARIKDINAYAEVYAALTPFMDLARASNCHVMLVHHAKKGLERTGTENPLGSQGLSGVVDAQIDIYKRGDTRCFCVPDATRHGLPVKETVLEMDPDTYVITSGGYLADKELQDAEKRILEVVALSSEPMVDDDICKQIEMRKSTIGQAIKNLRESHQIGFSGKGVKGNPYRYTVLGDECFDYNPFEPEKCVSGIILQPRETRETKLKDGYTDLAPTSIAKDESGDATAMREISRIKEPSPDFDLLPEVMS
ncbi:MAG: AAA family ATPase, partial [bacterium]